MNSSNYDFTFLIEEQPSLTTRLWREFKCQSREFRLNPKGYLQGSLAGDAIGRKRTKLLVVGMTVGVLVMSAVLGTAALFYYSKLKQITGVVNDKDVSALAPLLYPDQIRIDATIKGNDHPHGGGGAGNHEPLPPSQGSLPMASMTPSITTPSTHPSPVEHPALPVVPTVLVQPGIIPPPISQLGLPDGLPGVSSDGPGNGRGIGTGEGNGVGPGNGPGVGPGRGGKIGNGTPQIGGNPNEPSDPLTAKLQILNKPRPDYTEAARKEKITGQVIVEAVFRADGTITSVRVIRGLGYGLDEKAMEAVIQIRFRPAERNNRPVDMRQR